MRISVIFTAMMIVIVISNAVISISYIGFCVHEFLNCRRFFFKSVFLATSWLGATVVSLHSMSGRRIWSLILLIWWILFGIFNCVVVFASLTSFNFGGFSRLLPLANTADFVCLPFSLILCFTAPWFSCIEIQSDLQKPFLSPGEEDDSCSITGFSNAGICSKLTFCWLNSLFVKGKSKKIELSDVPCMPHSEKAERAYSLLEESFQKQKGDDSSSLPKAISQATWRSLVINAISAGVNTAASCIGPFLINDFVNFITGKRNDSSRGYGLVLVIIFFAAKMMESLTQRQWYFGAQRIGVQIRAALMVSIYKKLVKLKSSGESNGMILNSITVDVERIGDFFFYIHCIWLLPIQVSLALIILCKNLGALPAIAAFLTTISLMASNTPLASMQERFHSKIMEARDSRIKAMSEMLKSMRVLKLHSWESNFLKKLLFLRETERSWLKKYLYTCAAIAFLFWTSPTLVSVITFSTCILTGAPLKCGTVLGALATFRILQEPIYNLPELISITAQTKVSLDRIKQFLREEENEKPRYPPYIPTSDFAIELDAGEFAWKGDDLSSRSIAVKIPHKINILKGQKVAICGSVGAGKSSILCSILGEMPRVCGAQIKVYGSKAYVPQSAWIQSGTIRENVLFGKEMNKVFYTDVLEGCALNKDIEMCTDGDLTIVGERGVNLSGGQKQRIQLARAVYSDHDIFILDDPFSAVDAHTGSHLFKECLMKLLSSKTIIYATHQLEFLRASDLVIVMKDGRVTEFGKYEDLMSNPDGELVRQIISHDKALIRAKVSSTCIPVKSNQCEVIEEKFGCFINEEWMPERTDEEESETGRVKWSVYSRFLTCAYKGGLVPVVLLCQILFQALQMASSYWISWAAEEDNRVSNHKWLGVFILLSGGSSIFILCRAVLLSTIAIETAQKLFAGMVTSIFHAPVSFFDSTPSSQILNRTSTDQSIVDTDIPYRIGGLAFALIQLFSIIILMSHVAWKILLLFVTILCISLWYQGYYITTAREFGRMIGARKALILHHFSESITGVAVIRCFNQEERFLYKALALIDDYSTIVFHNTAMMEWLCLRINFLFNLVFFLLLIILVNLPSSSVNPSMAGLAATYGLNINVLQAWVIWNLCNVENKMISVERILQYSNVPHESPEMLKNTSPPPEWPSSGRVELVDLKVQYAPSRPLVLKGITCTFPGGKKIGVVGRTGSGKSTLIQALFRVVEPSGGCIFIDGMDICRIDLHELRSRLSIIPQDPTLFRGTTRMNLDPLEEYQDHEIWEVLLKCHLANEVDQGRRLLDAPVAADGENWSVGQRQLLCLARVLLQKRRVLVLDEATASVDSSTDNLIQDTIRKETLSRTVITVAHRIPTVVDDDFVLVLDEGKILEYDAPSELLRDSSSAFSKLASEFLRRSSKNRCLF